jgi:phenol 2-monooxygenase
MSTSTRNSRVDVLIVGAGAAGVFAAFALARAGVQVRIVDKLAHRIPCGHADGIQVRAQCTILRALGLGRLNRSHAQLSTCTFLHLEYVAYDYVLECWRHGRAHRARGVR